MSDIETIVANASIDELRTLAAVLKRANDKPAVVVTLKEGTRSRRYVVSREDEHLFDDIPNGPIDGADVLGWRLWFGGQWLRSLGKVDEMYRSLSGSEIVKVQRIDRKRVWGSRS